MTSITSINSSDKISDSRAVINTNFDNLNTGKIDGVTTPTDNAYPRYNGTGGVILQNSLTTEDDAGIITSSQSRTRAYLNTTDQIIPNVTFTKILLNAENYDSQSEFDSSVKTGTATSTSANHLVDSTAPFVSGDVGRWVWNTTDNTYATITVFNSTSDVTLSADIMTSGEGYKAYNSRFTATKAGYYLVMMNFQYNPATDGFFFIASIYKNGTGISNGVIQASTNTVLSTQVCDIVYLAATDYLEAYTYQNSGGNATIIFGSVATFMSIHKLS